MIIKRGINYRRHARKRIIKKRKKCWNRINPCWANKNIGKFNKNNFSCGCQMCKPHKYNKSHKFKHSERKQLLND